MSIRVLSSELQEKAKEELNEVPKRIQEDLKHIHHWISKQPHLNVRQDDQWLLNFLRGCKFSLEKTKQKLDMFYTMRTMLPEFFSNRDPFLPEIQEILELGLFLPLPQTNQPDGPRIIIVRCETVDPSKILLLNAMKTSLMILDILLNEDDNFVIAGQTGFLDLDGMGFSHAVQITPTICKKTLRYLQDCYPSRLKRLIFINIPTFFQTVYNIMRPFLTAKILDRFHIHNEKNIENIQKDISLSVLPKEYGGEGSSLDDLTAEWKKKVEDYKDWFLEDAKYCSDETKRIGEQLTSDCMFGVAGSFRQLDFD